MSLPVAEAMHLPATDAEYRDDLGWMYGQPLRPDLHVVPAAPQEPQPLTEAKRLSLFEEHLDDIVPKAVRWAAKRHRGIDTDDAYSDGALGLWVAAQRYDPEHPSGAQFRTFAVPSVRGRIIDGVRSFDKLGGVNRRQARVVSHLNNTRARSLDAPLSPRTSPDFTLHHVIAAPNVDVAGEAIEGNLVGKFYDQLWKYSGVSEEGLTIIGLRAQGYTHKEVATELGISPNRARTAWKYLKLAIATTIQPDHFGETSQQADPLWTEFQSGV